MAKCSVCGGNVGPDNMPRTEKVTPQYTHAACGMEVAYSLRGEDPAKGLNSQVYAEACEQRKQQTK